jgi:hypothetical protein
MRMVVDFQGGALNGHVEVDGPPSRDREAARRKIEGAAWAAIVAGNTYGVGGRFWSVSPEYVVALRALGPTEARAKGLARL